MNRFQHAHRSKTVVGAALSLVVGAGVNAGADADVRADGAFGFPQSEARVLTDTDHLRLAWACDGTHLFVQAVVWKDGDGGLGLTDDGRRIGDSSVLRVDVDSNGEPTANVDRSYSLDPWPQLPGMHYSVVLGGGASTGLQGDSAGRGAIAYVEEGDQRFRVDTFVIPLAEIDRTSGEPLRFAYWAKSPLPPLVVNSVGFEPARAGANYWAHQLPQERFHAIELVSTTSAAIDVNAMPRGRDAMVARKSVTPPAVGTRVGAENGPPEIAAATWRNWPAGADAPPTLASLRGKVVVVEFWATWCAPCIEGIPHLNELHRKHGDEGLVILSITDQAASAVNRFVDVRGDRMSYAIGMGSESAKAYGVRGIPQAFVIDRSGTLVWEGHPNVPAFDEAIQQALAAK